MKPAAPVIVVGTVGALVAAAGIWGTVTVRPAAFGWTAYSPLTSDVYVVQVWPPWWALLLVVVGSLAVGVAGTLAAVRFTARRRVRADGRELPPR